MSNPFLNPGAGTPLKKVSGSTGNAPDVPPVTVIPAGAWSETFNAHEGQNVILYFTFAAAATGSVIIEELIDSGASVAGEQFDTVPVSAERVARWGAGEPLTGPFRVKNGTNQNMTAYYNNVDMFA